MADMVLIGVLLYIAACTGLLVTLILRNRSREPLPDEALKGEHPTHSRRAA